MARKPPKPPGQQGMPRHKGQNQPSVKEPPQQLGIDRVTIGVPDWVKVQIANVIIQYSALDATLDLMIWTLTGLDTDDGRLLTKVDASEKQEILKSLCARYRVAVPIPAKGATGIWTAMAEAAAARNRVAHGLWGMRDLEMPICWSTRLKADLGQIGIETFPKERFEGTISQCQKIKFVWDELLKAVVASRAKLQQLPPKESPKTE